MAYVHKIRRFGHPTYFYPVGAQRNSAAIIRESSRAQTRVPPGQLPLQVWWESGWVHAVVAIVSVHKNKRKKIARSGSLNVRALCMYESRCLTHLIVIVSEPDSPLLPTGICFSCSTRANTAVRRRWSCTGGWGLDRMVWCLRRWIDGLESESPVIEVVGGHRHARCLCAAMALCCPSTSCSTRCVSRCCQFVAVAVV